MNFFDETLINSFDPEGYFGVKNYLHHRTIQPSVY